jgi:hypothetical protein
MWVFDFCILSLRLTLFLINSAKIAKNRIMKLGMRICKGLLSFWGVENNCVLNVCNSPCGMLGNPSLEIKNLFDSGVQVFANFFH